ncbi:MAG: hypothetical protein HDR45_04645 [Bacteroides sp.]|nr:hypothetical protein [Bacteroides sp.]
MSENKSEFIDFSKLLKEYRKNWHWFVVSLVICGIIGGLATLLIKPKYQIRANIMLTEETAVSKFLGGGLSGLSQVFGGNSSAEDEVQIMTSHSVLRSVVNDLGLNISTYKRLAPMTYLLETKDFPLELTPDDKTINIDTLRKALRFAVKLSDKGTASVTVSTPKETLFSESGLKLPATIKTDYGRFTLAATAALNPESAGKYRIVVQSPDDAAEDLREKLNIDLASKHSQIIEMQMFTDNEAYAIDILNQLIKNYNIRSRKDQDIQNSRTAQLITDRLKAVRNELIDTEAQLAEYKEHKGLGMVEADAPAYYERMGEAEKALTIQQVQTEMARLTLQLARESEADNSLIPPMGENDGASSLINSYNSLVLRRATMEAASKADNIGLQRLDDQIRLVRKNLIASLESAVDASLKLEKQYRSIYENARGSVSSLPGVEQSFRKIARDQAIEEQIYVFLLQKQEETNVLFANLNPKAQIIDEAYSLNEDESISPVAVMLIALLMGLLIPPTVIFIRNQFK